MWSRIKSKASDLLDKTYHLANPLKDYVFQKASSLFRVVIQFALGDIDKLGRFDMMEREARESQEGMAIVSVGPPLFRRHIVLIQSKLSPEKIEKQLKCLMDSKEKDARCPYSGVNFLTGSAFFLSMNTNEGMRLRRKVAAYFKPQNFYEQLSSMPHELFSELRKQKDKAGLGKYVESHILRLFSRVLFNFELSKELEDVLHRLEPHPFLFLMPSFLWRFFSSEVIKQQQFDRVVKLFLQTQIRKIKKESEEKKSYSNAFTDTIFSHMPKNKMLSALTDDDIDLLVINPEVRLCISGLVAVKNLTRALLMALDRLYVHEDVLNALRSEIKSQADEKAINHFVFMNKEKMPFLHALFLETLRLYPPMPVICRYTVEGIRNENLNIPPQSFVLFKLMSSETSMTKEKSEAAPSLFSPQRFLDAKGQLNVQSQKLHHGTLTPFAISGRMCPATTLSEMIFKRYLLSFAQQVKQFRPSGLFEEYKSEVIPERPERVPVGIEDKSSSSSPARFFQAPKELDRERVGSQLAVSHSCLVP